MTSSATNSHFLLTIKEVDPPFGFNEIRWRNVSFDVQSGLISGISGPSGTGKSTFFRILSRMERPASGSVFFKNKNILTLPPTLYRTDVQLISQAPQLFSEEVESELRSPFLLKANLGSEFPQEKLNPLLNSLNLDERFLKKKSAHLSSGQKQIVCLIRSLLLDPSLLLLDESTSHMDSSLNKAVVALLKSWVKEPSTNRAIIWITHQKELLQIFDRILDLGEG